MSDCCFWIFDIVWYLIFLGLHSLALPVLAHSGIWLWLVSISDEGSLPEIALSGASKLASTYFILFYRSVHVLYTEIPIHFVNASTNPLWYPLNVWRLW